MGGKTLFLLDSVQKYFRMKNTTTKNKQFNLNFTGAVVEIVEICPLNRKIFAARQYRKWQNVALSVHV